ncbi:MAG: hypothetical protein FJ280_09990 [Planctomycetes bacterium]|nr:hypothetical protein [Planctomycetota bacterium]
MITYTNRKGVTYFLGRGVTKTGKTRYLFAREPKGEPVEEIPEGYEIRESVNGVVSLVKAQPVLLREAEIQAVKTAVRRHPRAKRFRVEARARQITVYEREREDPRDVMREIAARWGIPTLYEEQLAGFETEEVARGNFAPVLRFTLTDDTKRRFLAERMCYRGPSDHWIIISFNEPIEKLARTLIPVLGSDEFFELY